MIGSDDKLSKQALKRYPDRFVPSMGVDPNKGMDEIRRMVKNYETLRHPGGDGVPCRVLPAGADQRQEVLPDLREVL